MQHIPLYIPIVFILISIFTCFFLYEGSLQSRIVLMVVLLWLVIQAGVGVSGFYTKTQSMPPRFMVALGIPLLAIIILFSTRRGRAFLDTWNIKWLTWLHVVRLPVELVLYWLFLQKKVPQLMTFEGVNFDILSGITAPIIAFVGFKDGKPRKTLLLIWNFICLGLLLNIVIQAVLSAPLPFQQLAFDQPNVAVLYFPYVWLPAFVVPAVLLSHLVTIRKLTLKTGQVL
jgi:hypothetical protein